MLAISNCVLANLNWMSPAPLRVCTPYLLKHADQTFCAAITGVDHRCDPSSGKQEAAASLQGSRIGPVEIETHKPMGCDPHTLKPATGRFVLIDPADHHTAAEGTILGTSVPLATKCVSAADCPGAATGPQPRGITIWFTGLSGAGKTTIARAVCAGLLARGILVKLLDADELRKQLNRDLGFSKEDRDENIRRIGFAAYLLTRQGVAAVVAAISPYRAVREEVRRSIGNFLEVYVNAPLSVCERRDPKGLYKKARAGEICGFTGVDDPYEPPPSPDIQIDTDQENLEASTDKVVAAVFGFLASSRQVL
jgi:adenylyl-sulfate kinase